MEHDQEFGLIDRSFENPASIIVLRIGPAGRLPSPALCPHSMAGMTQRPPRTPEDAPVPGDRGRPHPGAGDIQFEPNCQLDRGRRAAGRLGGGRVNSRCSNRSRGFWPKKRSAAVVPSSRVVPKLWTTVNALSLRWVR